MLKARNAFVVGAGPDTLTLEISEDAYRGDAQYTIKVDGKQIGGTLIARASHANGLFDAVTIKGDWAPGPHKVEIAFLNDLWVPNVGDRNLYLDGATYNGTTIGGASLQLMSGGTQAFSFTEAAAPPATPVSLSAGTGPDSLVLKLSQDAYQGSAQYTVSVDGKQIGDTFTASASRAEGQSDTLTLKGDWAAGPHAVSVTFVNDLYQPGVGDRNLHVDGATYNGAPVAGAPLHLMSGGQQAFSFTEGAAPGQGPTPAPTGSHQFFSDASPWNTTVGAGARYQEVQGLDALMDRYAVGLASWSDEWPSTGIYYATASDPVEEVRWIWDTWSPVNGGGVKRWGNSAEVDASLRAQSQDIGRYPQNPYSTQQEDVEWNAGGGVPDWQYDEWVQTQPVRIHVPANAVPAPDGDGYMVVVQPDGRALELYSPIKLGDGTLISMMYSFTDAENGLGIGAENGRRAAMVPNYAGAITKQDIADGEIDHALAVNLPPGMLTPAYTYPALAIDSNDNYSGTVPMGSRLAIPGNVGIDSLGLQTDMGRMMAEAAQEHGIIVVDRGGGGITVAAQYAPETPELSVYSWPVQEDLAAIFHAAQLVQPDQVVWL